MTKEELLISFDEDIEVQIPLRLDMEYGELVLTKKNVVFIVEEKGKWILRREWKKIRLRAWSLRHGIFGKKLILYFRIEVVLFHQVPKNFDFIQIFKSVEQRQPSMNDGYWQYYWRKWLDFFEEESADW